VAAVPADTDRLGKRCWRYCRGYRLTARLNVVASLATFLSALSLFVIERPQPGPYVLVDDLNIVFIVLNTFVGFHDQHLSARVTSPMNSRPAG